MTMRCVIVKDIRNTRLYWCEPDFGMCFTESHEGICVYDSNKEARSMMRACNLGKEHAKIISYDEFLESIEKKDKKEKGDENCALLV